MGESEIRSEFEFTARRVERLGMRYANGEARRHEDLLDAFYQCQDLVLWAIAEFRDRNRARFWLTRTRVWFSRCWEEARERIRLAGSMVTQEEIGGHWFFVDLVCAVLLGEPAPDWIDEWSPTDVLRSMERRVRVNAAGPLHALRCVVTGDADLAKRLLDHCESLGVPGTLGVKRAYAWEHACIRTAVEILEGDEDAALERLVAQTKSHRPLADVPHTLGPLYGYNYGPAGRLSVDFVGLAYLCRSPTLRRRWVAGTPDLPCEIVRMWDEPTATRTSG